MITHSKCVCVFTNYLSFNVCVFLKTAGKYNTWIVIGSGYHVVPSRISSLDTLMVFGIN